MLALTGDGAMHMNGMSELLTLARHRPGWADPRFSVMVNDNRDLNAVTWEMRIEPGVPDFPSSQHLPDVPYAKFAELLGFSGMRVEREELLPPHITPKQAKNFTKAFTKGDPEMVPAIVQSLKSVVAAIAPHGKDTP